MCKGGHQIDKKKNYKKMENLDNNGSTQGTTVLVMLLSVIIVYIQALYFATLIVKAVNNIILSNTFRKKKWKKNKVNRN